jgi:1-acyl-sn-glycerol-3-phosphate acyltransferase
MLSQLSAWIFRIWGWKIVNDVPRDRAKFIIAVGPHTSNWDFPVGVLTRSSRHIDLQWAGKSTLFKWPYGFFFRWVGGVPVERSRRTNFVDAVVKEFAERDHFWLTVAPEGTRKRVDKFKTGFYYIAKGANVPIVFCVFNWEKREVFFDPELFWPTDDVEKDMDFLWNYFKGIQGAVPENGVF